MNYTLFFLCKYTLQPATVNDLETFLEAILWKPFQLVRRILNGFSNITKALSLQCWFHSGEQGNISWSQIRRVLGETPVLSRCSLLGNIWSKTGRCAGALLWRRNQMLVLHISGLFLLTASLRRLKMSMSSSLNTVAIPVHYSNDIL